MKVPETLEKLANLSRVLGAKALLRLLVSRVASVNHFYLLGKSLLPNQKELALAVSKKAPLVEITDEDLRSIEDSIYFLDENERKEVLARLFFYRDGFKNCYIVKNGENIAYMQWIVYPDENQRLKEKYPSKFYTLNTSQVMVENAFTFPRYRGMGYLQFGTARLLDIARSKGYKSAVCYIRKDRLDSLNEFARMGFRITKLIRDYKILGREWRKL